MKNLKPTQELPEHFHEVGHFNLNKNRGMAMILTLTGIGLMFGVGWVLLESLNILRPSYLSSENILVITGMREFWRALLLLVVSLTLMVLLNETGRGIMMWLFTRQKPKLGFRGFYSYAAAPEWYFPRRTYLLIRLVPIALVTLLGLLAVTLVPLNLVPGVLLLISLNIASSISDLATTYWLLRQPAGILVMDDAEGIRIFAEKMPTT